MSVEESLAAENHNLKMIIETQTKKLAEQDKVIQKLAEYAEYWNRFAVRYLDDDYTMLKVEDFIAAARKEFGLEEKE